MKNVKQIAVTVLVVLILVVILQNTDQVTTEILWMKVPMPRAILLFVTLLLGFLLGFLFFLCFYKKKPK